MKQLKRYIPEGILGVFVVLYCVYFIFTTILKMRYLYGNYFDIGIMHQTVFNTFRALSTFDFSRFLEMTDPYGPMQLKRMAIHNDPILALLAPFYFIYSGPETLLVIQTLILSAGSVGLYLITKALFQKDTHARWLGCLFGIMYLINPAMQNANLYEFHGVVLATTFLIFMFYFWLKKRLWWCFLFFALAILTKEQVALTTTFFAIYTAFIALRHDEFKLKNIKQYFFSGLLFVISILWFYTSLEIIIPLARGGSDHFALGYYGDFGDSPSDVVISVLKQPTKAAQYLFHYDALQYLLELFQPVGFLALLSPLTLAIALPEFGVNLISNNANMRLIIYQYTAVITPFICIATVYGAYWLLTLLKKKYPGKPVYRWLYGYLILNMCLGMYLFGSLPFAKDGERYIFTHPFANRLEAFEWSNRLQNENLKISSTGKLAPFFSGRRYFYILSDRYALADYVILNPDEVYTDYGKEAAIPAYEALQKDPHFKKIYDKKKLQVYQKIRTQ